MEGTLFRDAALTTPGSADLTVGISVLVEDGAITWVRPSDDEPAIDLANVEIVDAGGTTMVPGMVDAHSHITMPGGGVRIAAGTDFGGGSTRANHLAWEVGSLVEAGLEPYEALAAATRWGGELLDEAGAEVIREGGPADFFLVHGDPLSDPSALWRVWRTPGELIAGGAACFLHLEGTLAPTHLDRRRRTPSYLRRRRDSNARGSYQPPNRLAGGCFRPLSHVSAAYPTEPRPEAAPDAFGMPPVPWPAPMAILALGISHRHATVELLERLAFADDDLVKAYRGVAEEPTVDEAVVISTCNRVEIYASVPAYHAGFQALKRLLADPRGVSVDELAESLYSHYEEEAVRHLFDVAAGLDSMVIGEPQILSQVRDAFRRAEAEGATGHDLTALFHAAGRAGRRVRTETAVGSAPDAFVDAGADLAAATLGGLEDSTAVVVGAGHMAALAVKHLRARGVGTVRILNRSLERARVLAERTDADHGDLEQLPDTLRSSDLAISATGAAGIVLHAETVARIMDGRERPLFVLDLAVPRDVEPSAAAIPGVHLVDIEGLKDTFSARANDASEDIERADRIVEAEVHRFAVRRRADRLAPLIRALRQRGDAVAAAELERFRSHLADLTPDEREAVEALAHGIVAKLLHDPIVRLKELSAPGTERVHETLLAQLYDLELPEP